MNSYWLILYLIPEKIWGDTRKSYAYFKIRLKVCMNRSQDQRKYNVKVEAGEN